MTIRIGRPFARRLGIARCEPDAESRRLSGLRKENLRQLDRWQELIRSATLTAITGYHPLDEVEALR